MLIMAYEDERFPTARAAPSSPTRPGSRRGAPGPPLLPVSRSRGGNGASVRARVPPRARPARLLTHSPPPTRRAVDKSRSGSRTSGSARGRTSGGGRRGGYSPRPSASAALLPSRRPSARRPRSASQETVSTLSARSRRPPVRRRRRPRPNSPLFGRFAGGDALFGSSIGRGRPAQLVDRLDVRRRRRAGGAARTSAAASARRPTRSPAGTRRRAAAAEGPDVGARRRPPVRVGADGYRPPA